MNLYSIFQDFNPSKFLVYAALLLFSLLYALRLDNAITSSYWLVFMPLWIWKSISIIACALGCAAWIRTLAALTPSHGQPQLQTLSRESMIQFRAMLFSTALNVLLLAFELLVCYNLEAGDGNKLMWIVVVSPLILLSIISIGIGVWNIRHGRSFDFEIFCSVNILEFIFVALKLDGFIDWSWVIVFIPILSTMVLFAISLIYLLLLICILSRSLDTPARRYHHQLCVAVGHLIILPPLLAFEVCLALKLDDRLLITYTATVLPLLFAFTILLLMTLCGRGFNIWWCGVKRDFLTCVLAKITPLQEYANVRWKFSDCFLPGDVDSDEMNSLGFNAPFNAPLIFTTPNSGTSRNQSANNNDVQPPPSVAFLVLDAPE